MSISFAQCLGARTKTNPAPDTLGQELRDLSSVPDIQMTASGDSGIEESVEERRQALIRKLPDRFIPSSTMAAGMPEGPQRAANVNQEIYDILAKKGGFVSHVDDWRPFQFKRRTTHGVISNLSYKKRRKQANGLKTDEDRLHLLEEHIKQTNDRRLREFAFLQHALQKVILSDKFYKTPADREKLIRDLGYTQNEWTHACVEVVEYSLPDIRPPDDDTRKRYCKQIWLTVAEIEELVNVVEKTVKKMKIMVQAAMKKDPVVNDQLLAFWAKQEEDVSNHMAEVSRMEKIAGTRKSKIFSV